MAYRKYTSLTGKTNTEIDFLRLGNKQDNIEFLFWLEMYRVGLTRTSKTSWVNFVPSPPIGVQPAGKGDNLDMPLLDYELFYPRGSQGKSPFWLLAIRVGDDT